MAAPQIGVSLKKNQKIKSGDKIKFRIFGDALDGLECNSVDSCKNKIAIMEQIQTTFSWTVKSVKVKGGNKGQYIEIEAEVSHDKDKPSTKVKLPKSDAVGDLSITVNNGSGEDSINVLVTYETP